MQFHLNGFRTGDPSLKPPATDVDGASRGHERLPEEVDVLIVGAGPTGLTLAAQLSTFPQIKTCLIERKPGGLEIGQADGIACRTMEMFDAFGFSERVLKEAYWVNETTFWKPDPASPTGIARGGRIKDTPDGLSPFPHVILNQARIHDFYLDTMANAPTRMTPFYSRELVGLTIKDSAHFQDSALDVGAGQSHPVAVQVRYSKGEHAGPAETVRARFVVGCDGARSTVRELLGYALDGESAKQAWGVMDVLAVTDFPDIRLKTAIHSQSEGSILIIPREGGYLTRLYIELDELGENERVADRGITLAQLIATARRILRPYSFEVKEVAWWSTYEIGQRLCAHFDSLAEDERGNRIPRVFIAGDACHTHSPKAGQGMNVSMQDGFNLGWKLASVLLGRAVPDILHTYAAERRAVAKELIDFDREMAGMFSAQPVDPKNPEAGGIDPAEFQRFFEAQGRFTAGVATRYSTSLISAGSSHQELARGFVIGMRLHSTPVIRLADARPMELGATLEADGRWRMLAFAPEEDPADPNSRLRALCDFLDQDPRSPIRRYTPATADIDSVIDVRVVLQRSHRDVVMEDLPQFLSPRKGCYGLVDYEKIFCADPKPSCDIFETRGVDRNGCIVVVRPDQFVAHVLPLHAHAALADFFDGFLTAPLH